MLRRLRSLVADRPTFLAALGVLVVIGAGFVVGSFLVPDGPMRDLLVNFGATALGVVLTALVLEPLIEVARRPEERIVPAFPHQEFISGVSAAQRRVRIMGAWPYVMDPPWRERFLTALRQALRQGTTVQVLVLDPMSHAAEQRQDDLQGTVDVAGVIAETLTALHTFRQGLDAAAADRLSIHVYSVLPPARLYLYDQRAICSFLSSGNHVGTDTRHYDTNVMSGLARFVDEQFDAVWNHPATRSLSRYWYLWVTAGDSGKTFETQYVEVDGRVYVASRRLVDDLFRRSARPEEVRLHVTGRDDAPSVFAVDGALSGESEVPRVREAFVRKYAGHSELLTGFSAILRLVPPASGRGPEPHGGD